MEVSGQLHVPDTLSPEEGPRYSLDRRLGGPQKRSGSGGEEKNIPAHVGDRTSIVQPGLTFLYKEYVILNIFYKAIHYNEATGIIVIRVCSFLCDSSCCRYHDQYSLYSVLLFFFIT
jgi:hypothetical protein